MKWWCLFILVLLFSGVVSAQICSNNLAVNNPQGVAVDANNAKYIADTDNNRIIKIDTNGVPVVFAGDSNGVAGFVDGQGTNARFDHPHKIMINPAGNWLYVADTNNNAIRKINLASGAVLTVAGQGPANAGLTNGPLSAAKFDHPKGIYVTSLDEILIADTNNHVIRRLSESVGNVITIIGTGTATNVNCPSLLNCPDSNPTTCLNMGLKFPQDIVVYTTGPLASPPPTHYYDMYIADTGSNSIKAARYELGNGFATSACNGNLIAGNGLAGYALGSSTQQVQFNAPTAIDVLPYNLGIPSPFTYTGIPYIWVVDSGNHVIRYLSQDSNGYRFTVPYAGAQLTSGNNDGTTSNPFTSTPASSARFNTPGDIFVKANSNYPYVSPNDFIIADSGNDRIRTISGTSTNAVWNVGTVNGGSCAMVSNTCPTSDNVILRLSSPTNAHGELYNGAGTYTTEVCYSQIFGSAYTGSNPHACSTGNSNRVLRLSSPTNAHAEIPDTTNPVYGTDVCYGDLVCHSITADTSCPAGEQEIVSLSGQTNAHLETASANVYSTSSNYKICCSNTPPITPGSIVDVGWSYYNLLPPPVAANTLFCPNSAIYAFATTSGVSNGVPLTFNFYDWDPLSNDFIFGPISATVQNNVALYPVNFADPNVQNVLNGFLDGPNNDVELMFRADIASDSADSYIIRYVDNTALCVYNPPTATINAPVHQGVYFANTLINFVASCSSQAGPLSYSWNIVHNGNTITNTNPTFQQTFNQGGQATVTLTCTDLQGLSATEQKQILIVASPFAFAYINDPAWNGVEYETPIAGQPYFPRQVSFDASDSFAVDTTGACSITCLGGNCPQNTQNSPASCTGNVVGSSTFGQSGGAITISNAPPTATNAVWSNMNFDWTFWDGNWNNPWTSNEGPGAVGGFLEYDDTSDTINDKHMSINLQVGSASASFQRDFTLGRCMSSGNSMLMNGVLQSTSQDNVCLGGDQIPNTGDECCPTGQVCADVDGNPAGSDGPFNCQFLASPVTRCEDFQDQNSCDTNTNPVYPLTSYGNQVVPVCTFLQCYWASDDDGCGVRAVQYQPTSNGQCTPSSCILSSCTWNTEQTECINGRKTIQYTVTSSANPNPCPGSPTSCERPSITVPCGSLNFELDFFGTLQFVTAILIIGLFYAMFAQNFKEK